MFNLQDFIKNFFKLPVPHAKKEWENVFESMIVHTRGKSPGRLLNARRPNETKEVFDYRVANYKAITYGSMGRAMDELHRIVSNINFKYSIPEKTNNYLIEKRFSNDTFLDFMSTSVLYRMIEDPNGLLVWLPSGDGLTDSSQRAEPEPYLVYSMDILAFLSNERSWVTNNKGEDSMDGAVFYILTKNEFYKLVQVGKKSDLRFVLELIYEHQLGEIPYVILKGNKCGDVYQSYFSPYLAFGNEAIVQFSDWQAVMVTSSFPYIEQFETSCEVQSNKVENDKLLSNPIPTGEVKYQAKEPEKVIVKSPYGTIIRKIPVNDPSGIVTDLALDASVPSIRFINPDINVAKYAGESWKSLIEMAEDALHLNLGRGTFLSGEAKKQDKQSQDAMITKIGNNFFDNILFNSLVYINGIYNGTAANRDEVSIEKPNVFNVKTEEQIVEEITNLQKNSAPAFFTQEATRDLAAKRFSGSRISKRIFNIITIEDPLYVYSVTDKNSMMLAGVITKEAYIKSVYIYSLLLEIANELTHDKFLDATIESIIEMLNTKLAAYTPRVSLELYDNTQATGENGANIETPTDVEAEAKAKLKGTVGGVQGILEIQGSVAAGITDYNSAITLLYEIYGFDDATAKKLLGTPKKPTGPIE